MEAYYGDLRTRDNQRAVRGKEMEALAADEAFLAAKNEREKSE